jgi:hypothetical protein
MRPLLCSFRTPLQASYIFAAAPEANYLSRFLDARISCINHIATELLGKRICAQDPAPCPMFRSAHKSRATADPDVSRALRSSAPKCWGNSVSTLFTCVIPVSTPPNSPDIKPQRRCSRVGTI